MGSKIFEKFAVPVAKFKGFSHWQLLAVAFMLRLIGERGLSALANN